MKATAKLRYLHLRRTLSLGLISLLLAGLGLSGTLETALAANVSVTNSPQIAGKSVNFKGLGYAPGERVGVWATSASGEVRGQPEANADAAGGVNYNLNTLGFTLGRWTLTMQGLKSKLTATTPFMLVATLPPSSEPIATPKPPPPVPAKGIAAMNNPQVAGSPVTFRGGGFAAGEGIETWTTDLTGTVQGRPALSADSAGQVNYNLDTLGFTIGQWTLTMRGLQSKFSPTASFKLVGALRPTPGPVTVPNPSVSVPKGGLKVTPDKGYFKQYFQLTGAGFAPDEVLEMWQTDPLGYATQLNLQRADNKGNFGYSYEGYIPMTGLWRITVSGVVSKVKKTGYFYLDAMVEGLAKLKLSASQGDTSTVIKAEGSNFFAAETYSYWWTAPNGKIYGGGRGVVGSNGSLTVSGTLQRKLGGVWSLTIYGQQSTRQAKATFRCDC